MEIALFVIAIIALTAFSGYCSGTEAVFFSLPSTRLQAYRIDPNPRRRLIAQLLQKPRDLLVTVFMLNTLANIVLESVTSSFFGVNASWFLIVGVPLILVLIFGELLPKYIGIQNNISLSYILAPSINFFQNLLTPIRKATIAITAPVSRMMFFYLKPEPPISKDELQHLLRTSQEHGVFNADEGELISGYLALQDSTVKELMWPREDILFYNIQEPLTKLTYLFVDQECSRLPVCDGDFDHVLGIVNAKEFLVQRENLKTPAQLQQVLDKPFYVPESTPARTLLRRFYEQQQLLALVVDEYGSVSGLITIEDLMEVVIGDVIDRRDQKPLYTQSGPNQIIASGKLELAEFNEIFNVDLQSKYENVTIGGWLTEQMGEIPKSGTDYQWGLFHFQILAATPNRIRRLYIRKQGGG